MRQTPVLARRRSCCSPAVPRRRRRRWSFPMPNRTIDYRSEVKPLLDKRCVVCHSCYNSPCQLKLDSFEGADRGATKKAIYNGHAAEIHGPHAALHRRPVHRGVAGKSFFSVTESKAPGGLNDSIMIELLSHKMKNPKSVGEYRSEAEDLTCSEDQAELGGYLEEAPEPRHALRLPRAQAGGVRDHRGLAGPGRAKGRPPPSRRRSPRRRRPTRRPSSSGRRSSTRTMPSTP